MATLSRPRFPGGTAGGVGVISDLDVDSGTLSVDEVNNRVGIGTTSPTETLDVVGIGSFAGADASQSQGNVRVGIDASGNPGGELMYHTDDHIGLRCADSGALPFAVKPDGKVGIGTTSPAQVLDVIGIGSFAGAEASLSQGNVQVGVDSGGDPGGELMYHTDDYVGLRCADSGAVSLAVKPSGKVGIGLTSPKTLLTVECAVTLKEQADADADTAAYGQLWVKTATPNELYFTTDAGDDIKLTTGTGAAGGGASLANDGNNRVTTGTGSGGINGEANLLFDGSTLTVTGGVQHKYESFSGTSNNLDATDHIVGCDTSGGAVTVTLPAPSGLAGLTYIIKDTHNNAGTNNITITPQSGDKIDTVTGNHILTSDSVSILLWTDGTDWFIS